MKNKDCGRGRGGGLNREGGLINFPPLKRGGFLERGGLFERVGLIEDLWYVYQCNGERNLHSAVYSYLEVL